MEQLVLQSGTGCIITKWDSFITGDTYYKVGQFYLKVGRVLQSETIMKKWSLIDGTSLWEIFWKYLFCNINIFQAFYIAEEHVI